MRTSATTDAARGRALRNDTGICRPSSAAGALDAVALRGPPSRPSAAGRVQRGRTLLAVLLVMELIAAPGLLGAGILTGAVAGMERRSSARELAAQLRFTRTRAIATGPPQQFTIDPDARAW